jgi:uncharacterized protein YlzI (FlbEa/FlbD family)
VVRLTRLDGSIVYVNVDVIVVVEDLTGSAVLKLQSGDTMRVQEGADVVADRCHHARAEILRRAFGVQLPAEVIAAA